MLTMASKTNRAPHFNRKEKELLLQLITEKVTVLESKLGDVNTAKIKKRHPWDRIAEKLSAGLPGRDVNPLQGQWKRMKMLAKKEVSDVEKARGKRGEYVLHHQNRQTWMALTIKELVPREFQQLENLFDDDAEPTLESGTLVEASIEVGEVNVYDTKQDDATSQSSLAPSQDEEDPQHATPPPDPQYQRYI